LKDNFDQCLIKLILIQHDLDTVKDTINTTNEKLITELQSEKEYIQMLNKKLKNYCKYFESIEKETTTSFRWLIACCFIFAAFDIIAIVFDILGWI